MTPAAARQLEQAELTRVHRVKARQPYAGHPLGPELVGFFKQSVAKRQAKLGTIAECWNRLVPETLSGHCALEGLSRGTLTVLVDSSPHLYEVKQLLLAGLEQQLLLASRSTGLRKVSLKLGRWYESREDGAAARVRFD